MKYRVMASSLILLTIAAAAGAYVGPVGYIGLFTDQNQSAWCVNGIPPYSVEMWICCLPSEEGQYCAEFAVEYPANVVHDKITINTAVIPDGMPPSITCDDHYCYIAALYTQCQWSWHWLCHETLWVLDQSPTYCRTLPHPGSGLFVFASCAAGHPNAPCKRLTNLYFNHFPSDVECQATAVEPATWGSIKTLLH
jgi:hypothetical protein